MQQLKIAIAGTGYVDLANGVLLSQYHEVVALDMLPAKVDMLNRNQSPIEDAERQDFLTNKPLNFRATLDKQDAYTGAHFVISATPIDYDPTAKDARSVTMKSFVGSVCGGNHSARCPG
ncbi:MAG: hypothetical protein U5L73_04510 [Rhodoferax sp.]|uniref:hypothetical protein n=1 Tax=Rhodoferax sp. TaxID=50421 RepID=UPI002ACEE160|nr:hypothetical protein [Rhodoferax sp.]MDZ7891005.1 hypothetical protein [Rhodoferax sp.]